jgi:hypothetical protein
VNSDHRPATPAVTSGPSGPQRSNLSSNARRLTRAAIDLDTDLITRLVQESCDDVGAVSTWERLVQPVWQYLGSRPDDLGEGLAAEHAFVRSAMRALSAARRPAPPSSAPATSG